jgi:hypothetical protein
MDNVAFQADTSLRLSGGEDESIYERIIGEQRCHPCAEGCHCDINTEYQYKKVVNLYEDGMAKLSVWC